MPDEEKMLMQKAAGLAGGIRFGGEGGGRYFTFCGCGGCQ
ncbi:hypothetical protein ECSTEC7V_1898 [Escherichia coli STEC_7v]|nr:hypothetical protein ECSTEC7V_1898 [Escherichia coli STEC_7v]